MIPEYFIDRIGNISVQGPVVSLDLGRMVPSQADKKTYDFEKRATITLTGQNFLALVNSLNQTVKAISEKEKAKQDPVESSSKKKLSTTQ
jgi:hypothetical protein